MAETGRTWHITRHMTLNGSGFGVEEAPDLLRNTLAQGALFS